MQRTIRTRRRHLTDVIQVPLLYSHSEMEKEPQLTEVSCGSNGLSSGLGGHTGRIAHQKLLLHRVLVGAVLDVGPQT